LPTIVAMTFISLHRWRRISRDSYRPLFLGQRKDEGRGGLYEVK
jgi:hypothetical protein